MAPLKIEVYGRDTWAKVGDIKPGNPSGSISNNNPNGSRDVYVFECLPDNSGSVIYRSKGGCDAETGRARVLSTIGTEVVRELKRGDLPYEMEVKTDRSAETRRIRFTHV